FEPFPRPLLRPDRLQVVAYRPAKQSKGGVAFQLAVEIVEVPGCTQAPEASRRLEQVEQVFMEERLDPFAIRPASQSLDVHEGLRGTDDLDAQTRITTEFPQNANAHLDALAVVARQFDQGTAVRRQERLQVAMNPSLAERPAVTVGETQLGEGVGTEASTCG